MAAELAVEVGGKEKVYGLQSTDYTVRATEKWVATNEEPSE